MKINKLNLAQIQKLYQQQQNKNTDDKKTAKTDKINISEKAREIKKIQSDSNNIPEIREDKVRKIKEALENGQYRIEARKIAEKILSDLEQE